MKHRTTSRFSAHARLLVRLIATVSTALPLLALAPGVPAAHATVTPVTEMGATGMNVNKALSTYTKGDPNVVVAYVEGGINWRGPNAGTLADAVYVNWHETPVPCKGTTVTTATMLVGGSSESCHTVYSTTITDYQVDGSTKVNVLQWRTDPRVHDAGGTGFLDPEDLISAFCTATYSPPLDSTGRPCDVSGWDFYDNQNDPATVDAAYDHANDQMSVIHQMCPTCMIMPVKAGDEALDQTDTLAKAWQYAAAAGAKVIVSVTADLGFSPYMRQVVDKLEAEGVAMVEASNDFDSTDHQGGMYWPYVVPGNGSVASVGGTAWIRSDETSWGVHNELTAATGGGSTSESTPTLGGVIALTMSYGEKAYANSLIPAPLNGPEVEQVLEQTATPFTTTKLAWPGTPKVAGAPDDWNQQYGYGMPNVYAAMQKIAANQVPAEAAIDSPDWYTNYDPTSVTTVPVTGHIDAATPTTTFTWKLEAATGPQPSTTAFTSLVIGTGSGKGSFTGTLGTLDLSTIPQSFWDAPYTLTTKKTLETTMKYTVTFRLVVTETATGVNSEDRRAINVVHDPTLLPGFPMTNDAGSAGPGSAGPTGQDSRASVEGEPQLVDLQGNGNLDMVYGDSAGLVHAVDPKTGLELPGWPVQTQAVPDVISETGITPGGQPIIANVAVGDLFHTGQLDVVVVTLDGTVDVYNAEGQLLPGWPQVMNTGVTPPAIPRPSMPNVRLPNRETASAPVLASLTGTNELDIVAAGGDGHIHAWTPDGVAVPGWPVNVALPATLKLHKTYTLEADHRLEATPALAWLNGHNNPPDIVERSQFTEIKGPGVETFPYSFIFAYSANGTLLPNWPVQFQGVAEYYGSAQEEITEGTSSVVAADITGTGTDEVVDSPLWTTPIEINGKGTVLGNYGTKAHVLYTLLESKSYSTTTCDKHASTSQPAIPFTSSGAFGKLGGKLVYAQSGIGARSLACVQRPNAGLPITEAEMAYPANAANAGAETPVPGYPAGRVGDGFLSEPIISDISATGTDAIIEGGDASTINAVTSNGSEAPGFPKFTSGWNLYAPVAGDLLSNAKTDIVTSTREGYLYAWSTTGNATDNDQWWSAHHDEHNSGNYGVDSRPPGALRSTKWTAGTATASFTAPGTNWYDGTVAEYVVTYGPSGKEVGVSPSGAAGTTEAIVGPAGTTGIRVEAKDSAGNLDPAVTFGTPPPPTTTLTPTPATTSLGYTMVASDGGIFNYGDTQFFGSMGGKALDKPIVGIASTPDGKGYWEVASDGGIFSFGDAAFYGSMGGQPLNEPIVGIAATPDGKGYWEVASDGGIFSFGDAQFFGSMGGQPLNEPIVGIASTPDGKGYREVASDGGIFSFGDAAFYGSMGGQPLNEPIVGIASNTDGKGYREVASDGGIFSFGDAAFDGSMGGQPLNKPIVGIAGTNDAKGYWEVASDGGIFSFGDAQFFGSAGSLTLNAPVVGMTG